MEFIINAFAAALSLKGILAMVTGTVVGLVIGALPGLGPSIGVALMLPFTYTMDPLIALLLLTSLFQGAEYGGSVSAVLLNTPGTPGASATVLDGYPMNRQGFPGKALACSLVPSCLGGLTGVISLFALSSVVVKVAVTFGPAEFFSLGLFGLTAVVSLSNGNLVKGCIAAILGLVISCVGLDVISGMPRFTLGVWSLYEGFPLVPVLIGMFAISEAFVLISEELETKYSINKENLRLSLTWREFKAMIPAIGIGSAIGVAMGIFPGVGTTTASWLSYNETKRFSKHPEKFGTGIPEGIAAPEAANNAVVAHADPGYSRQPYGGYHYGRADYPGRTAGAGYHGKAPGDALRSLRRFGGLRGFDAWDRLVRHWLSGEGGQGTESIPGPADHHACFCGYLRHHRQCLLCRRDVWLRCLRVPVQAAEIPDRPFYPGLRAQRSFGGQPAPGPPDFRRQSFYLLYPSHFLCIAVAVLWLPGFFHWE